MSVLCGLVPVLDLALGLRMVWGPSNLAHTVVFEEIRQISDNEE